MIGLKSTLHINRKTVLNGTANLLPASKSISNRVLIMDALSARRSKLHNLSDANDTQLMMKLIQSPDRVIDVEDAGTTMRFLTAYFAITLREKILTGTARMKERPIGILVNALRTLGAEIAYTEKDGYPPLHIKGFAGQRTARISIRGDVSSQFISALMMVGPILPEGLTLTLEGKIGSKPYIEMTAALMREFGVSSTFSGDTITVPPQQYRPTEFTVESDWSAASYWFAFAALAGNAEILLPRIALNSLQGDRAVVEIMRGLGVEAVMDGSKLRLTKSTQKQSISWDFTHCPDLAQTIAVVCAAKGVEGHFTGLESLRIKETDRIAGLQNELKKIGAGLVEEGRSWKLIPSTAIPASAAFETYKDHRMAMAFAPLACVMDVAIENPLVVRKSYPRFWDDLANMGFLMT